MGMTKSEIAARIAALKNEIGEPEVVQGQAPVQEQPMLTKSQLAEKISQLKAQLQAPEENPSGLVNRAGQFARGLASGIGATSDINPGGHPLYTMDADLEGIAAKPTVAPMSEELPRTLGLGEEFEPEEGDTLGKISKFAGQMIAPAPELPLAGYGSVIGAAGKGVKAAGKALAKELALSGAIGASVKGTPRLSKEGSVAGTLEDFAKGLFGARTADKIVSKNLTKTLAKIPKNIGLSATTMGAKPNERTFELAKKHGVELPFNVGMRSKPMNWMANNYLKSIFTSGVYEDALKNSNESMVNAIKRNIDGLGDSTLKPSEASGEYRRFIELEEKAAEKAASKLYAEAAESLTEKDTIRPTHTSKFIENMRELLGRDIQSPATKKVANVVGNLAESWGIAPSGKTLEELEKNPKLIEAYLNAFKKNLPNVPIEKLIGVRKELGTITNFDPTIKGSEAYLNGLKSAVDLDIQSTKNKEFLEKWRHANSEFKKNVGDRFRGDIARSLLANEMPTEAYSLLNTPANVREIEKIVGQSEKGREVFNALKKAKVREIFSNALQDESLRLSPFINVFNKKEKTAEHLASLLPDKKTFNNLSEIAEIAEEFKNANQELLNTSRTALTASEIAKAEKLTKGVLSTIFNGAVGSGVGAMAGIGSTGGAAIGIAMPNLISRLVANPKFVNDARAYAIARKNNRQVYSDTLLKRLIKLTDAEQRLMATELRSMNPGEE